MTALLDVNVLLALLDDRHIAHEAAQEWFHLEGRTGFATCPIVQNGFLRIAGSPAYSADPIPIDELAAALEEFCERPEHQFWPDDISLLNEKLIIRSQLARSSQLTDAYLLALAVRRGGRLVTLDRRMSPRAVIGGVTALVQI